MEKKELAHKSNVSMATIVVLLVLLLITIVFLIIAGNQGFFVGHGAAEAIGMAIFLIAFEVIIIAFLLSIRDRTKNIPNLLIAYDENGVYIYESVEKQIKETFIPFGDIVSIECQYRPLHFHVADAEELKVYKRVKIITAKTVFAVDWVSNTEEVSSKLKSLKSAWAVLDGQRKNIEQQEMFEKQRNHTI